MEEQNRLTSDDFDACACASAVASLMAPASAVSLALPAASALLDPGDLPLLLLTPRRSSCRGTLNVAEASVGPALRGGGWVVFPIASTSITSNITTSK